MTKVKFFLTVAPALVLSVVAYAQTKPQAAAPDMTTASTVQGPLAPFMGRWVGTRENMCGNGLARQYRITIKPGPTANTALVDYRSSTVQGCPWGTGWNLSNRAAELRGGTLTFLTAIKHAQMRLVGGRLDLNIYDQTPADTYSTSLWADGGWLDRSQ